MTTNLFAAPSGSGPVDGWLVRLPEGWALDRAVVLRYGSERVPVEVRRTEEAAEEYAIVASHAQRGPHELILRVEVGSTPGTREWSLVPFVHGPMGYRSLQEGHRVTRSVDVGGSSFRSVAASSDNRALAVQNASPLLLRSEVLPHLAPDADFTIEFWLKTTGLEEVVLSTWTGYESTPYPLEVMVDVSGRLRYYCGRHGRHQSITTRVPVADGHWHHVAIVHKAAHHRLVLLHEGMPVDSLSGVALPSVSGAPLAVGGRVPDGEETTQEAARQLTYSGQLDEIRFWNTARPAAAVRRMARRGLDGEQDEGLVVLDFDEDPSPRLIASWPQGAERVASDLVFNVPLRNLQATVEGGAVHLAWEAANPNVESFIIERSVEGEPFRTVGRVRPRQAEDQGSGSVHYEFTDPKVGGQIVYYRIRQQFGDGTERISGTVKIGLGAPERRGATLIGNFPNPFSETTTVAYEVHETQPVRLTVWDLSGHQIGTLIDETHTPGYYEHTFQADNLSSGTYFVRLKTPSTSTSHRMVLLK